jgi:hypothetical protein
VAWKVPVVHVTETDLEDEGRSGKKERKEECKKQDRKKEIKKKDWMNKWSVLTLQTFVSR